MNIDDEFTLSRIRLQAKLNNDVEKALIRIQAPTSTEMREAIEDLPRLFGDISDALDRICESVEAKFKAFSNLFTQGINETN